MHRDLRVMMLTYHGGGFRTNGLVAEGSALVTHAHYANVFRHQLKEAVFGQPLALKAAIAGKDDRLGARPHA
jgi:hypothetical protein